MLSEQEGQQYAHNHTEVNQCAQLRYLGNSAEQKR